MVVNAECEPGAAQGVPHGEDVRLAGSAGKRGNGEIDLIRTGFKRRFVGKHAASGCFMRMKYDRRLLSQELARHLDRIEHLLRAGGAGRILEAERSIRNAGVENAAENRFIETGTMPVTSRRQFHHGDGDFMVESRLGNAFPAVNKVVDIVERIEVADGGNAVFLHQVCMKLDDVPRLGIKPDHVDAAGESLEIRLRTCRLAEIVHDLKRIFVGIEVCCLEQGAAARFEVFDSRCRRFFDDRQEVAGKNSGSEYGLKSVTESCKHEIDLFHKILTP